MIHRPLINLPLFVPAQTVYNANNDNTIYYSNTNDGKVMLPPDLFQRGLNLNNMLRRNTEGENVLTAEGDALATHNWQLYPFIRSFRDELNRPVPCEMTEDGKRDFVILIVEKFGGRSNGAFGGKIIRDMEAEIVRRCKADGMTCPSGADPASINDVEDIIKALKGKPDHEVFNYIFNWVSSITMDSGIWLVNSVREYFQDNQLPFELPPDVSFPSAIVKHSILRMAIKSYTEGTKAKFRKLQKKVFFRTLKLDEEVHKDKTEGKHYDRYQELLEDPRFSIVVFQDTTYVPRNRLSYPAFILVGAENHDSVSIASRHLNNAINAAPNMPLADLIQMLTIAYNAQHAASTNIPQAAATSTTVPPALPPAPATSTSSTSSEGVGNTATVHNVTAAPQAATTSTTVPTAATTTSPTSNISDYLNNIPAPSTMRNNERTTATIPQAAATLTTIPQAAVAAFTTSDVVTATTVHNSAHQAAAESTTTDDVAAASALMNITTAVSNTQSNEVVPPLLTAVTEESVEDTIEEKEYVKENVYYECKDPKCLYFPCKSCYNDKCEAALAHSRSKGSRARTRKISGNKRQREPHARTPQVTCDHDCYNNPFCMVEQKQAGYFRASEMAKHHRTNCSVCGKYFKEKM